MNPKVDAFISNAKNWKPELEMLRKIILDCNLIEDIKWRVPCYTFQNSNIVMIQGFKAYCGLLFFKGALLNDANQLLVKPGENTQSGRLIRFTNTKEIVLIRFILYMLSNLFNYQPNIYSIAFEITLAFFFGKFGS
jgi:uncharacterized protein YdeI (YjbR/CyaY-like superfamily)